MASNYGPLRERVFKSSGCYSPDRFPAVYRPNSYKQWTPGRMNSALKVVVEEHESVHAATNKFNVPKSTFGDRVSGRVLLGATSGSNPYLSVNEQEELVRFLCRSSAIGHGRTRQEVIAIVERVLASRGSNTKEAHHPEETFLLEPRDAKTRSTIAITSCLVQPCPIADRHPEIVLRTPATLSISRAGASDRCVLDSYYDELESTLFENGLSENPCSIFNMDETGMPLDPSKPKVATFRGTKNPIQVSGGEKSQVTIVGCVSASGQSLPPMVIWDRKALPPELAIGEVPGTIYGLSEKGWMDQELFDMWFHMHFLKYAPLARPLLLLMDGHSSHFRPATIRCAAQENVIMFTLPPNTTHLTQPLDKAVFRPLKMFWKKACHNFIVKNSGMRITKAHFSSVFSEAWIQALTPRNIMAGFRTTGIFPFNRNAIQLPGDAVSNLSEVTGIAYIPLYSPVKRRIPVQEVSTDSEEDFHVISGEDGDLACSSEEYMPMKKHTTIGYFLPTPTPTPTSQKNKWPSRMLNSAENVKKINEKEREKEERACKREQRHREKLTKRDPKPFSQSEHAKFSRRYENGFDIKTDEWYNAWVKAFHPADEYCTSYYMDKVLPCIDVSGCQNGAEKNTGVREGTPFAVEESRGGRGTVKGRGAAKTKGRGVAKTGRTVDTRITTVTSPNQGFSSASEREDIPLPSRRGTARGRTAITVRGRRTAKTGTAADTLKNGRKSLAKIKSPIQGFSSASNREDTPPAEIQRKRGRGCGIGRERVKKVMTVRGRTTAKYGSNGEDTQPATPLTVPLEKQSKRGRGRGRGRERAAGGKRFESNGY